MNVVDEAWKSFSTGHDFGRELSEVEIREMEEARFWQAEDGRWYLSGYGPVRGGWGYCGSFGNGYGPVYRP